MPPPLKESGCLGFHVMDDYLRLVEQMKEKKRICILGAGLVAMELAAALREKGNEVTVIAPRERILRRYFDMEASSNILDRFTERGVAVHLNLGRGGICRDIERRDQGSFQPGQEYRDPDPSRLHRGETEDLFSR